MRHPEIINLWPKPAPSALADDLGVDQRAVRMWRFRGRIPAEHWSAVVKAAERRGFPVSLEMLADAVASERAA